MLISDYESDIERAATPEDMWRVTAAFFVGTEVDRVIYLHLPPIGAPDSQKPRVYSEAFPADLATRYLGEGLYRDNPMLRLAQQAGEPVYWDLLAAREPANERERKFIAEMKRAELGDGVGVPVYGPSGRSGQFGLGFRAGVRRLEPGVLAEFQLVCQIAHVRYCTLVLPTLGPSPALSERETEVLAWVARGKTNATIAEILGISAHTVDAHLRRIYLKLGVFDRISAAVRGMGVGIIHGAS